MLKKKQRQDINVVVIEKKIVSKKLVKYCLGLF